jgi:hypothetical protein
MSVTTAERKAISIPKVRALSEWRFVAATIVLTLVITSLPYLYAFLSTPPDKQYMGIMLDVPDHVQYFSWMRELSHSFLASNKLTPEPNKPIFFNLLWWGMGRLGLLLGLNFAGMFQVLRIVATILLLLLVYRVCSWFLQDRLMRRTAFLLISFTSGFGWILIVFKYVFLHGQLSLPLDVYIAEGNTFLDILGYPHFVAAALYIFVFDLMLRGQAKAQLRYAVAAGGVALFLGWQHAYDLILVYGILGSYILFKTLRDRKLPLYMIEGSFLVGVISCAPALYSVWLTTADPVWKAVLSQFSNAGVYTPPLWQLPILFGVVLLMALFTVIKRNPLRLKQFNDQDLFLLAWFLISFGLVYLPTDYQIHMLNGWQVPMSILAVQGLFLYIIPWLQKIARKRQLSWSSEKIGRFVAAALVMVVLPTNIYLFTWRYTDLAKHDYPYYLYKDELAAMKWLETNAKPDEVVLSSLTTGQYIPALTGTNAFLAHWAQTLDFYGKSEMVQEFFNAATTDARRQQILQNYHVRYVFYGPAEKELGAYNLDRSSLVKSVFTTPTVKVYAVLGIQ